MNGASTPPTTTPPVSATSTTTTLPPDVHTARATRINADLITIFSRPCPLNNTPTAQGTGLYTHIQPPHKEPKFPHERYLSGDPEFLPIGGPRKVKRRGGALQGQVADDVKGVWREARDVVGKEEEEMVGGRREGEKKMGLEDLRVRYGGLREGEVGGRDELGRRGRRGGRGGFGGGGGGDDVVMGAAEEPERRGSAPVRTGSTYDPVRDPRKRGR